MENEVTAKLEPVYIFIYMYVHLDLLSTMYAYIATAIYMLVKMAMALLHAVKTSSIVINSSKLDTLIWSVTQCTRQSSLQKKLPSTIPANGTLSS